VTVARTVLGDIDGSEMGLTYAHEHLIIAGGKPVEVYPDIRLDDVGKAVEELEPARRMGLGTVIDAMPSDCGRDIGRLAEVSRRSGVRVIASTGLHTTRYYPDGHWSERMSAEEIADLFVGEIAEGIDAFDLGGPSIRRTPHRAGVIKVGGSAEFPDGRDARVFEAAAIAHVRTGAPILTHCERGTRAVEQVRFLTGHGVDPSHVAVSHVDKVVDRGYHREIAATGAHVEYDQAFRWPDRANGTLELLEWMVEDGLDGHVLMGNDAARRGHWTAYGGRPGLTFLLGEFAREMDTRGIPVEVRSRILRSNPVNAFAFTPRERSPR
jgi:phosphotriesterase-related protein